MQKAQHALSAEDWGLVEEMLRLTALEPREGRPETLYGALSCKLHGEGTVRSAGQFATVVWTDEPIDGLPPVAGWRPVVFLFQYFRGLDGRIDRAAIALAPPPVIKPGRKATACKWYARQESPEFTRLVARACDPLTPLRDRFQAWADKKEKAA